MTAAASFAFNAGEWDCVLNLATAIFDFFQVRGHWADAEQLYIQALKAARHAGNRPVEARTLNFLGLIYRQQGRWADAESAHRDSLAIWRETRRPPRRRPCSQAPRADRSTTPALRRVGRALRAARLLREVGDPLGEAKTLTYLGNFYRFDCQLRTRPSRSTTRH